MPSFNDVLDFSNTVYEGSEDWAGDVLDFSADVFDEGGGFFDFLDDVDLNDALNIAKTGLPIASGISGLFDSSKSDAAASQRAALEQQNQLALRAAAIGNQGGDDLSAAFANYLNGIGDNGFYDPEQIDHLYRRFDSANWDEFHRENKAVNNLMRQLREKGRSLGPEADYSEIANVPLDDTRYSDIDLNRSSFGDIPLDQRSFGDIPLDQRSYSDVQLDERSYSDVALDNYYNEMGRVQADVGFREGNYDGLVNELSRGFLDRFSDNTERAVDNIYADQEVDAIRRGMDRSTYDIEGKKAASAQAKKLYDEDVMKAIDEAMAFVQERQGLDTGNQGMRMNQLQGELEEAGLGINARRYGTADRFNKAGLQMEDSNRRVSNRFSKAQLGMSDSNRQMSNRFNKAQLQMSNADRLTSDRFNREQLMMSDEDRRNNDRFNLAGFQMDDANRRTGDRFKKAGLQMSAGQNQYMDKLRALEASQNLMNNSQGMRRNMWNTPSTQMQALDKAFSTFGKFSDARGSGLQEMAFAIGKPYEYRSTGVSNAGNLNSGAVTGWNNAFNSAAASRNNAGRNLGFGLDQASNMNWDNIFGDDD